MHCHSKQKTDFLARKNSSSAGQKGENCESCHKRHGFSNKLVLVDNTNQLCFSCHTELKDKYSAGQRARAGFSRCMLGLPRSDCSRQKALLRLKGPDDPNSCMGCHQQELASTVDAKFPTNRFRSRIVSGVNDRTIAKCQPPKEGCQHPLQCLSRC